MSVSENSSLTSLSNQPKKYFPTPTPVKLLLNPVLQMIDSFKSLIYCVHYLVMVSSLGSWNEHFIAFIPTSLWVTYFFFSLVFNDSFSFPRTLKVGVIHPTVFGPFLCYLHSSFADFILSPDIVETFVCRLFLHLYL